MSTHQQKNHRMSSGPRLLFASIVFSRTIYSVSWFVTAAVFPAMASEYGYSLQTLGYFTSAFLVGAGAFQIPVGIYAARNGPKKPALLGLVILTVVAGASVLSGDFSFQLVLRFLSGVGAALFFAPGLVIASGAMGSRSGLATGIYAGVYYLGGGLATFAFPSIASEFGWRVPFIITAVITAVALLENILVLRGFREEKRVVTLGSAYKVLKSRSVLAVAIGIIGGSSVNYVVTQFLVTYAQVHLGYSAALAGAISSLVFIGAIIGGPIGGLASDRIKRRRLMIALPAVAAALAVSFFLVSVSFALVLGTFLTGFLISAIFANAYAYPTQLGTDRSNLALSIGVINITGLLYGSLCAPVFALAVGSFGYSAGWLVVIAMSILPAPLIYLAKEPDG